MKAEFHWRGLEDMIKILATMPDEMTGEASHIIESNANAAALDLRQSYARVSGHLRDGVEVEYQRGHFSTRAMVRSRAPHAYIYDYGTVARHTALGHDRGTMFSHMGGPPHTFVRTLDRHRRRMYSELSDMLTRFGLVPRGSFDVAA